MNLKLQCKEKKKWDIGYGTRITVQYNMMFLNGCESSWNSDSVLGQNWRLICKHLSRQLDSIKRNHALTLGMKEVQFYSDRQEAADNQVREHVCVCV